jgi:hypothetical protein
LLPVVFHSRKTLSENGNIEKIMSQAGYNTIFAIATPPGRSAIAVIRISGPLAGDAPALFGAACPKGWTIFGDAAGSGSTGDRSGDLLFMKRHFQALARMFLKYIVMAAVRSLTCYWRALALRKALQWRSRVNLPAAAL